MRISKYTESLSESRELLKQAIAFIGAHHLSPTPVNYTVCYEYLTGMHAALKKAIDSALSEHTEITDLMMEQWFKSYLSEYDLSNMQQTQSDLMDVVSALAESTRIAEENVSEFGHTLRRSEKDLVDPNSSMESIIMHLLASTKSIQASMDLMRQKMEESRNEITSLKERIEKISEEAMTDPLTGLVNRKGLTKAIEAMLLTLEDPISFPSILMIDIDHFKNVNDTYGHLLGDQVIKVVAENMKNQIKGKDTAARQGGEEFCILLPETRLEDAFKVADKIRQTIENTRIKRTKDQLEIGRITISIGVARYQKGESILDFFQRADMALYQSKNEGRNRVTCAK